MFKYIFFLAAIVNVYFALDHAIYNTVLSKFFVVTWGLYVGFDMITMSLISYGKELVNTNIKNDINVAVKRIKSNVNLNEEEKKLQIKKAVSESISKNLGISVEFKEKQ